MAKYLFTLPDGTKKTVEGTIHRNVASPNEDTGKYKEHLLRQLNLDAERQIIESQAQLNERRAKELHQAQLAAITAPVTIPQVEQPKTEPSALLSEVIEIYLNEGRKSGNWEIKTHDQKKATLKLFHEVIGDIPIHSIDRKLATSYKQKYMRLPSNKDKKPNYKGKTVTQLLDMTIPDSDVLSPLSVNNELTPNILSFIDVTTWLVWLSDK